MRSLYAALTVVCLAVPAAAADPLIEKYLFEGKLADGIKASEEHLKSAPNDDQVRFGLAVARFFQAFEHGGRSLHRYGARPGRTFGLLAPGVNDAIPENPAPEKISYADLRKMVQTWVDDVTAAEAELAKVRDPEVKLPLHVARIQLDLFGLGQPVRAGTLFGGVNGGAAEADPVIAFDRGDVAWFRGYLHVLAAWGELLLALDGEEMFNCSAHLFFEKVDGPHAFLQEEDHQLNGDWWNRRGTISDIIAFFKTMRFPIRDSERMKRVLAHLEGTVAHGKEMWTFILAETDDDREWIPSPKQKNGVLQIQVTESMVATWKSMLDEADLVLQGKSLLPFWRGKIGTRGVNLRKVFTEPRTVDPFLWIQGTAATPYLEQGPITPLARRETLGRIEQVFGPNFLGFMFWFN